jgi:hypothetical protein
LAEIFGREYTQSEIKQYVGDISQICGTKVFDYSEGRAAGTKVIEVNTGSGLFFSVLADRALDIAHASYRGKGISHIAKSGIAHGSYYEPREDGWFRTFFAGLLTTCGLSNTCAPCDIEGIHFGLHGRLSNIPADKVNIGEYWENDDYIIEISGNIREAVFYGENLLLKRLIKTKLGAQHIEWHDTVVNEGYSSVPLMILYHFNLGFPLLNEKSRLYLRRESTSFFDEAAEKGENSMFEFQKPTHNYFRQVFIHSLEKEQDGRATVALIDERDRANMWGVYLQKDESQLPYLFEFKMMGQSDYQLGLEPTNTGPYGRKEELQAGRIQMIEPGEERQFDLNLGIIDGNKKVERMKQMIVG